MSRFGDRLKLLRNEKGLSQQKLAERIGMSKSSVNMYERGEREPGLEILETLADIFNCDIEYLLGASDIKNKYQQMLTDIKNLRPLPMTYTVPRLGNIACGAPIYAEENFDGTDEVPEELRNIDFTLVCKGDSMIDA
ncbi:MAG: helix-turn-helix domain-containing protein, partial [Clostridia bacterium]|nr:helix-turn-helix domain-containing protein [Clostridia bacterium]